MRREQPTASELVARAPFERLVKMIERELQLAGEGRAAELQQAVSETGAYMRTLPAPAPPQALALVHRATALRSRVAIETRRLQERLASSRASVRRARRMTQTYVPRPHNRYQTKV